jgi:SAM-dependent methyltransferase
LSSSADAGKSFGGVASAYAERRPGYPAAVFDALEAALKGPRRLAIELGAGSGQATRDLASRFERIVAVEPDARMLGQFPNLANVEIRNQPAEEASFTEGSVDAVIAATSFHWMDQKLVIANVRRWLRAGGVFFPFLYDAFEVQGPAEAAYLRRSADWAPFKDRRLIDRVDYVAAFREAAGFSVTPYVSEIRAEIPAETAARLLGTASFVNAFAKAQQIDIDDYVAEMGEEFGAYGATVKLRAPLNGVIAVKMF